MKVIWPIDVERSDCPTCHSVLVTFDGEHCICPSCAAIEIERLRAEVERLRADRLVLAEHAANLLIGDIYETLMGMVSGWRDTAHDHYCQTYNKGMGEGLENCAKQLEAYLNGMYQRDRAAVARRAVDAEGGG